MLKTITSSNSLVLWNQNINNTNLFQTNDSIDLTYILLQNFINVFNQMYVMLLTKQFATIIPLWITACNKECENVSKLLQSLKFNTTSENIAKVVSKFRGNVGEIFAEHFFNTGKGSEIVDCNTYDVVNPHNEEFIDAIGDDARGITRKVGIQVKNWKNEITRDAFGKSEQMCARWYSRECDKDKFIEPGKIVNKPFQYIFSFTPTTSLLIEEFKSTVIFLGPNFIDNAKLHTTPKFFKQILDELNTVKK